MRKFINFLKKPMRIIASVIFAFFAVIYIGVCTEENGEVYEASETFFGVEFKVKATFKDDVLVLDYSAAGEFESLSVKYRVDDGQVYTYNEESKTWVEEGKIDAFNFEIDLYGDGSMKFNLECQENISVRTACIVMMVIFGIIDAACITVLILDKKGIIKLKSEAKVEETESEVKENAELENKTTDKPETETQETK